jgi:hypothetical protein
MQRNHEANMDELDGALGYRRSDKTDTAPKAPAWHRYQDSQEAQSLPLLEKRSRTILHIYPRSWICPMVLYCVRLGLYLIRKSSNR